MRSNSAIPDNLIASLLDKFVPRFAPGSKVIHAIGVKPAPSKSMLQDFGVIAQPRQKIPDAVLYCRKHNWLLLVEAATGNGLMNENRLKELAQLFAQASPET